MSFRHHETHVALTLFDSAHDNPALTIFQAPQHHTLGLSYLPFER